MGLRTGTFQLVCSEATKLSPERTSTSACPHRPAPAPTPSSFPHPWPTLIVSRHRRQTLATVPRRGRSSLAIRTARPPTSASAHRATTTACRPTQTTRCPRSVHARRSTVSRAGIASLSATGSSHRFYFSTPAHSSSYDPQFAVLVFRNRPCSSCVLRGVYKPVLYCVVFAQNEMNVGPIWRHVASTRDQLWRTRRGLAGRLQAAALRDVVG